MSSQVFYRKWRPQTLSEVVGQEQVTKTLLQALSSARVSHAYLFCGPRGTGKTSTGRILAKAVNCLTDGKGEPCNTCDMCKAITEGRAFDVIEIDAASNRGIDEIRELRERVNYAPNQARYKVYIIDEVHMLTKEASNALLKTLEEPPPHVIFILATTEAHKVLPTILSRCQHFDFRRIPQADVISKLKQVCQKEDIQVKPEGLRLIAKATTGSLRDAENLLEQLSTYYGSMIDLGQIRDLLGISGDLRARELVKHIINNDAAAGITTINAVNSDGLDLRQFNREIVEYLRGLLLIKTGSGDVLDLTADDMEEIKSLSDKASLSQILKAVKLFGQLDFGFDSYSSLPLELALVDCVVPAGEKGETVPPPAEHEPKQSKGEVKETVVTVAKDHVEEAIPVEEPIPAEEPAPEPEPGSAIASAEEAAAVTPPETGNELERLRLNWKQVIEHAPENTRRTAAVAILRSAGVKPVAIEDDTIVLAFRYPLHKENMEKSENLKVVEQIISHFLGRTCRIRCVHEPEDNHLVKAALKIGAEITDVEEK